MESGFWDFVILSRGESDFVQAGHWWFVGRKTENRVWCDDFERVAKEQPAKEDDSREPDVYAVEFRDAGGVFGVHQVQSRAELLRRFESYRAGGDWRGGLSWELLAGE